MGELTLSTRWIVAPNLPDRKFVHKYEYDSHNRLLNLTYPDNEKVSYFYDLGGNLVKMSSEHKGQNYTFIKQIVYDEFEQRTAIKYGNNRVNTYSYDPVLRRLSAMSAKQANNSYMLHNVYEYDFVGNITQLENMAGTVNNKMGGTYIYNYTYDQLNRLKTANGGFTGFTGTPAPNFGDLSANFTLAMEYDNLHNITTKNQSHSKNNQVFEPNTYENGYTYSQTKPHQLEKIVNGATQEAEHFFYDANGNLHKYHNDQGEERAYFWDEQNRLRSAVIDGGKMMHCIYDASGERTLKAQSEYQGVFENGAPTDGGASMDSYTTYPSPYLTIAPNSVYTKHYYAGTQRVASRPAGKADFPDLTFSTQLD